ncbi:Serine/threonine protein kinase, partial [Globisporangium splendens]
MAPEQIDVHLSIARDGNRIQPDDPSVESDIYSFGMCILEATSRQIWKGANGINYPARVRNGNLLKRPGCLDDDQWGLILRTCARNKRDRRAGNINSGTIKSALDGIHSKLCSSKVLWMQEKVHPALEVIYEILVEQERQPNDHVVKKYCTLLVEVRNHLRMGVSEESLAVIARSQHVAETHNGIYSKLDGLLDILEVQDNDPVRSWRQDSSDFEKRTLETGSKTATSEPSASNQTVSIIWFNNPPQDTLSSHSHPALRELGWFHPLSDVSFGESDKIGGGDFGEVCKGIYSGTAVIVKFMGYEGDSKAGVESTSTALFLHEVQVWSRLKHPHIIRFYGANHVDKRFFVCEFAPNGAIRDCAKRPESSIRERWQKMYEVALGLQHMHERGIVHNDLKCDNILIGANGDAKIIDFGLSCILSEAEIKVETKHIGAAHWRSPEYLRGERVTAATDVYSLAMCIIELMTDDIPWGCKLLSAAVKYKVLQKSIPNRPDIFSDKQWALIKQTTAFEPSERVRISVVADKLYYIVQASETATAAPSAGTQ